MQLETTPRLGNYWPFKRLDLPVLENEEDWLWPAIESASGLSMSEDDRDIFIEASLPGIDPKEIEVTFERGVLWIRGEAKEEDTKRKYYHRAQRSFVYRLSIPETVDPASEPEVTSRNGVLRVTFNKVLKTELKKIKVKEG